MKTRLLVTAFAALGFVFIAPVRGAAHQPGAEKISVEFPNWQHYADIKDHFDPSDQGEVAILDSLREAMTFDAKYVVPDGDHLTVTFQDIHLAGDFEPWRGAQWEDVRIVKDIYPPHFKFHYRLTDAAGKVIKEGNENILDLNFQMDATINPDDPLHYEKDILKGWMDRTIRS